MKFIDPNKLLSKIEFDKYGNITTTMSGLRIAMGESEVEAEPVKHGRWVELRPLKNIFVCSLCGQWGDYHWNYCLNCGALMVNENADEITK